MPEYNKTDQQLHYLSQVLAKANRTYLSPKDDDSHTNLFFDALGARITGRWIQSDRGWLLPSLHLNSLSFQFLNPGLEVMESIASISKNMGQIEKEIESLLPKLGLDPKGFVEKLHFEIPQYSFADQPISPIDEDNLSLWIEFRSLANQACYSLLGHAQVHEEVRIWPHHFDTGIYFKAKKDLGVGAGLAMKDSMAGSPYFYMAAYPQERKIHYTDLPEGNWEWKISDSWKGAVLTINALNKYSWPKQLKLIGEYLTTVYHWMISH